jgi:hypothetical protein
MTMLRDQLLNNLCADLKSLLTNDKMGMPNLERWQHLCDTLPSYCSSLLVVCNK